MQPYDDDHLIAELAACEAHMRMTERELELLAWLPTAHFFTVLERLHCARAQMQCLLSAVRAARKDVKER